MRIEREPEPTPPRPGAIAGRYPAKPYLSIGELATLTPWTEQAIRSMMKRGIFREGMHFFKFGRRVVFKWNAVVDLIEHREAASLAVIPLQRSQRHEPPEA